MPEVIKMSWRDVEKATEKLAQKIKSSDFQPDCLVGITVGGLVPLALLAKELGLNKVLTVSASSYEKDKQGELTIIYMPEADLSGKKVLLVDEIADTGTTLKKVAEALVAKCKPQDLKTATLAIGKEKCLFRPDFFVLEENAWLAFPWERKDFPEYFPEEENTPQPNE